jgi:hypothetical protein
MDPPSEQEALFLPGSDEQLEESTVEHAEPGVQWDKSQPLDVAA